MAEHLEMLVLQEQLNRVCRNVINNKEATWLSHQERNELEDKMLLCRKESINHKDKRNLKGLNKESSNLNVRFSQKDKRNLKG